MLSRQTAPTYQSGKRSVAPEVSNDLSAARGAGMTFLASLAGELSRGTVDLPCFPDIVVRVRRALDDPNMKPDQVVTLVGAEPRLAAKLLHTANSAAFNPTGKPVGDLRSALTRLGQQQVQSATVAFAVQQMKDAEALRPIAEPLTQLWRQSIAVAAIAQVVARRTKVNTDEAFLTGLLHGIGRLYIMARSAHHQALVADPMFVELVSSWHPGIGKAVIQNWGFAEPMAEAIGSQADYETRHKLGANLTDVLIVSILLGRLVEAPAPRVIATHAAFAFQSIGLTEADCATILTHTEYQLGTLYETLGC
jgi:HD-like signal output (HDOD) protein